MSPNALRELSKGILSGLAQRRLLRDPVSRKQSRYLDVVISALKAAEEAMTLSEESRRWTYLSEAVQVLKKEIRGMIPEEFGWWLEVDHDVRISVRWIWMGHPSATHSGSCSDCDVSILLDLLRQVNWEAQREEAMRSVEDAEAALLKCAQERRRLKLTNTGGPLALPPVELPPQLPVTFDGKKSAFGPKEKPRPRATREQMKELEDRAAEAQSIARQEKQEKRKQISAAIQTQMHPVSPAKPTEPAKVPPPAPPAAEPTPKPRPVDAVKATPPHAEETAPEPESAPDTEFGFADDLPAAEWTGNPSHYGEDHIGEPPSFFLSRNPPSYRLRDTTWILCDTLQEAQDILRAHPYGTFRQAWAFSARLQTVEAVWNITGQPPPENVRFRAPQNRRYSGDQPDDQEEGDGSSFWRGRN